MKVFILCGGKGTRMHHADCEHNRYAIQAISCADCGQIIKIEKGGMFDTVFTVEEREVPDMVKKK
jgi:hydrogenase maturation factor HypF (carbamoyltransferase family)